MASPQELRLGGSEGIAALRWGNSAKKVLAVHGRLDNAASFSFVGPQFAAAGYELVAIDLPGHGFSAWKPDGLYTLVSQSCSIVCALDDLGWSRCVMLVRLKPLWPTFCGARSWML